MAGVLLFSVDGYWIEMAGEGIWLDLCRYSNTELSVDALLSLIFFVIIIRHRPLRLRELAYIIFS
jgi:hypothetical protein